MRSKKVLPQWAGLLLARYVILTLCHTLENLSLQQAFHKLSECNNLPKGSGIKVAFTKLPNRLISWSINACHII